VTPLRSADLPWMHRLFRLRYPNNYDANTADTWFAETVLKCPTLFLSIRTKDAFLIALLSNKPWLPDDFEVFVIVVAADHGKIWQTPTLLRHSIDWAKRRGAKKWRFQSDTTHDIKPLMRRVGATAEEPRYIVEF
jgi:hypothetical protein